MRGKYTLRFIPFPRGEEPVLKVPSIVYKCQGYDNLPNRGNYGLNG